MPHGDDTSSGSGSGISDASAMDVDQSQVFPLPPGAQAQVDFGHTWKQVTGVFNGEPKTLTEVANFVKNFERAIVSGNWTQLMTITNFSQVLVGDARTWLEITEARHPEKSKKWQTLKVLFEKEFKTQADDNERRTQIKTLTQKRNESARAFSYRVQHTLLVVNDTMSKLPADATVVQKAVAKALKEKNESDVTLFFMSGLLEEIRLKMEGQLGFKDTTFDEKVKLASEIEQKIITPRNLGLNEMKSENKTTTENKSEEKSEAEIRGDISALNRLLNEKRQQNGWRGNRGQRGGRGNNWAQRGNYNNGYNQGGNNQRGGGGWNNGNRGNRGFRGGRGGYQNQEGKRRIKCFRCRKFGYHVAENCPVPATDLNSLLPDEFDAGIAHPYEINAHQGSPLN